MKKPNKKIIVFFMITLLLVVFLSSMIFLSYKSSAQTSSFDLKDNFEDYINNKIFSEYDNITTINDYAFTELDDAWDFNEGDVENFLPTSSDPRSLISYGGDNDLLQDVSGAYNYWWMGIKGIDNGGTIIIDADEYYMLEIKCKTDTSGDAHELMRIDDGADATQNILKSEELPYLDYRYGDGTYDLITFDLRAVNWVEGSWSGMQREGIRFLTIRDDEAVPDANEDEYYDYIKILSLGGEDALDKRKQEISSYRASQGLKSFLHNFEPNVTYYEDLVASYNQSIKIEIPSVQFFPDRCYFNYYSNVPFNFSLFIGTTEFLLFENINYLNEWFPITERIDRRDYLINNTNDEIYFEIYTFRNVTEYIYIDELNIRYTDVAEHFNVFVNTHTGSNLSYFDYNASSQYFKEESSGQVAEPFNKYSRGIFYATESNLLFTRRMYHKYNFELSEEAIDIVGYLCQNTTFYIDKTYEVVLEFQYFIYDNGGIDYMDMSLYQSVYVDGIREYYSYSKFDDYYFSNMFHFELGTRIIQEGIDSIAILCDYKNSFTGNATEFKALSFRINENEEIQTTFNVAKVITNASFYPSIDQPFPPSYFTSDTDIILKITRDITHTLIEGDADIIGIPEQPIFDENKPFKSFFIQVGYIMQMFITSIKTAFRVIAMVTEILSALKGMIASFGIMLSQMIDMMGTMTGILTGISGSMVSGFSGLLGVLSNIWGFLSGDMSNFISSFFDSIISPFTDTIDTETGAFPIMNDLIGIADKFGERDWEGLGDIWDNINPPMILGLIENTRNFWGGFGEEIFGVPLWEIFATIVELWSSFVSWLTILIIVYMVHLCQLVIRRDWDRLRNEINNLINSILWVIRSIVKFFHWIFEIISLILEIIIPFT